MPANIVKTKRQERWWEECKGSVAKSHPGIEGTKRYWKLVMGCFLRRKKNAEKSKS